MPYVGAPNHVLSGLQDGRGPVVHGLIRINATGNWAPKVFLDALIEHRRDPAFRRIPFLLEVQMSGSG